MKINPEWRLPGKEIARTESNAVQQTAKQGFADIMRQQDEQASQDRLRQMLQQIELQAERLTKSMTVRELRQYKRMVKQFLEQTARRGVGVKETRGWDRRGRGKRYKLLEEIDGHLLQLADEMLENEQGRIDILHKMGEIRGLLINFLY